MHYTHSYGFDGDDVARSAGCLRRCVPGWREARPGFMTIRHERLHTPIQRGLVEDDRVVETLAPDRADDALCAGAPPGRPRCCEHFLGAHGGAQGSSTEGRRGFERWIRERQGTPSEGWPFLSADYVENRVEPNASRKIEIYGRDGRWDTVPAII